MDKWDELKNTLAVMTEHVYNGFMYPLNVHHKFLAVRKWIMEDEEFIEVYCPTCGSCGEAGCCPPTRCKYGVDYINGLRREQSDLKEELEMTRKALGAYIQMMGFKVTEDIIDQEIEFYGK